MDEINTFEFGGLALRVCLDAQGEAWFVAKDVAAMLDYRMASDMTRRLDEDEKGTHRVRTPSGDQDMTVINESGLYSAILCSTKPMAKLFKKWVTGEVLPSIRKTGGYIATKPDDPPEVVMAKALKVADNTIKCYQQRLEAANKQIEQLTPAAEYTKKVLSADNLHTANSIAVTLGISATALNKFLVAQDWIYKQGGVYYPTYKIRTKRYCDFHIVPYAYDAEGNVRTREHLKWTEEGRQAVIQLWREVHGLLQFGDVIL